MKKGLLAGIITVLAIIAIVGIVVANKPDETPQPTATTTQNTESSNTNDDMANMNMNPPTSPSTADDSTNEVQSGEIKVDIKDYAYSQKTLKIKKGTTVTWTNQDSVKHDVAPDEESDAFKPSELLAKGESYSFTFNTVGTYAYHCSPHPYMKASVEVTE